MRQKYIDRFIKKVLDHESSLIITLYGGSKRVTYKVGWFKEISVNISKFPENNYYVSMYGSVEGPLLFEFIDFRDILPIEDLRNSFREHILRTAT